MLLPPTISTPTLRHSQQGIQPTKSRESTAVACAASAIQFSDMRFAPRADSARFFFPEKRCAATLGAATPATPATLVSATPATAATAEGTPHLRLALVPATPATPATRARRLPRLQPLVQRCGERAAPATGAAERGEAWLAQQRGARRGCSREGRGVVGGSGTHAAQVAAARY